MASYWKQLPADEASDRRLMEKALPHLVGAGQVALARRQLENMLDAEWDTQLARLYAHCGTADPVGCLTKAEAWLKKQPRDAGLLYSLGRLCIMNQLWGKAQSYLEASLALAPAVETHLALARLSEQLERGEDAQRHYRSAAELGIA
jgi:HemY protein